MGYVVFWLACGVVTHTVLLNQGVSMARFFPLAAVVFLFSACGTTVHTATCEPASATGDDALDVNAEVEEDSVLQPTDAELVRPFDTVDQSGTDPAVDTAWEPAPGELGYPCTSGEECLSGYCVQTPDGRVCTITCLDECPSDWSCAVALNSPIYPVFVCSLPTLSLCRPCITNADCWPDLLWAGERCLNLGSDGMFCGSPCLHAQDCPSGYSCAEVEDVTGELSQQCVLDEGSCTCLEFFTDVAASTTCFKENEWGVCTGQRVCLADGLSPCSAPVPAPEACNGIDDDCDDEVDEDTGGEKCYLTNEFGSCTGVRECADGLNACTAMEPGPEACDGADNDCDGVTDESFADTDGDGFADCLGPDTDADGIDDANDNCPSTYNPGQGDTDLDNLGNACDPDDDNDGAADNEDCAPLDNSTFPGAEELCNGKDDNCNYLVDEGFKDTDCDGWKDCLDPDIDGDDVPNDSDNCPLVANEGQADSDGDGLGDACHEE